MFWQLLYHTLTSRSNIWQVFNVVSSYDWNERKGLTPEDSSIKFNCDEQWNSFVKYSLVTVCSWLCKKGKSNRISVLDACLWSISSFVKEQSGLMGAILPQKTFDALCYNKPHLQKGIPSKTVKCIAHVNDHKIPCVNKPASTKSEINTIVLRFSFCTCHASFFFDLSKKNKLENNFCCTICTGKERSHLVTRHAGNYLIITNRH